MTIHAYDKNSGESQRWVAVPLELVDWMKARFSGAFVSYLGNVDPYESILIPSEVAATARDEISEVKQCLIRNRMNDVPQRVDLFGEYGQQGAVRTASEMVEFFDYVASGDFKVVSVGD